MVVVEVVPSVVGDVVIVPVVGHLHMIELVLYL